jgi:hypothetical protein
MRSHGVADFPDPPANGRPFSPVDAQQLGVSATLYQVAEHACQPELPGGGSLSQRTGECVLFGDCPAGLVREILASERPFAACMRSHGQPNFPDPTISAKGGRPVFDLSDAGIDQQSSQAPQFLATEDDCRHQSGDVPLLPTS